MWKRWVIIAICIGLIVARLIRPTMQIDVITIWLIVIAAILFMMPELKIIIPYIKRVKVGDTEVELKEQIKEDVIEAGKEVEKAQEAITNKSALEKAEKKAQEAITNQPKLEETKKQIQEAGKEVEKAQEAITNRSALEKNINISLYDILLVLSTSPSAALTLLSEKIEQTLKERFDEAGIKRKPYSPKAAIIEGIKYGLFPKEVEPAFDKFWTARNMVTHSAAYNVDDKTLIALVSVGSEVLKMISTRNTN